MGRGGVCRKINEDERFAEYEYYSYDLDIPECRNEEKLYDGRIVIAKSVLAEPETHEKIKRKPNGKKQLVRKTIPQSVDVRALAANGSIMITNCSHTSHKTTVGIDVFAVYLCREIFRNYQLNGALPESCSVHQ
jgi:hypothetical protein